MCTLPSPDRQPFVYVIRDTSNNKRYAGVKFSKGCRPSDLLTVYFTSSKVVKSLISEGRKFVVDKIVEFDSKQDAIEFEELLLLTVGAHLSDDWYNLAAGRAINPDAVKHTCMALYGVDSWMKTAEASLAGLGFKHNNTHGCFKRSDETKRRMSVAFTGRVHSDEHRAKISEARIGCKASEETKEKMSEVRRGVARPQSFSDKMSVLMSGENNPMYGKVSPRKGVKDEQIQCEHCGKSASKGNHIRWHGENCKHFTVNEQHRPLTSTVEVNTDHSDDPAFIIFEGTQ